MAVGSGRLGMGWELATPLFRYIYIPHNTNVSVRAYDGGSVLSFRVAIKSIYILYLFSMETLRKKKRNRKNWNKKEKNTKETKKTNVHS